MIDTNAADGTTARVRPPVRTIVFAKAPQPGLAKTRLIPALGPDGAALLARTMLVDTLAAALEAGLGPVELCGAPDPRGPAWRDVPVAPGVELSSQGEGDLGERMARAAGRALARGEAVILVGTDCVEMSPELLGRAARALRDADVLIHPTRDGGYALLGLARFDRSLFDGVAWSTPTVAAATLARIDALGWSRAVGVTLHDLDVPADLHLLRLGRK